MSRSMNESVVCPRVSNNMERKRGRKRKRPEEEARGRGRAVTMMVRVCVFEVKRQQQCRIRGLALSCDPPTCGDPKVVFL